MADDSSLAATLTDAPDAGSGLGAALSSTPPTPTATPDTSAPMMNQPAAPTQPDLPRFQRTFGNTLKGILMGTLMNGIPGGIVGGIDPQAPGRQARANAQMAQAKITFANAQAAHEVAMAHQADVEYQALPTKLQQEAEGRGLENMEKAKAAGYLPVASIPLDQGEDQNTQNANTALNSVKTQFGAVPSGLLYVHTGNGVTVMKLQDPNAALPVINQARRAQGMPEITQGVFGTLKPEDRDSMARNAINFTSPRDASGMVSQQSLNEANMRLETVKAQPDFNGKSDIVAQLQSTVDHQKAIIDSGAVQEAQRKGAAAGAEAQAAQPGETAAKVADINATAGPQAEAAGKKAGAEAAAKFPWEERLERMKQQGDPVFAYDAKNQQTVQVSRGDALANGYTNIVKVGQGEIDKAKTAAMQLGDAAMNISAYKMAAQKMDDLSGPEQITVSRILGDDKFKAHFLGIELPVDWANQLYQTQGWDKMPEDAKDAVVNYIAARPAAISLLRAINPGVRLTESQIATELKNIPSPGTPADIRDKQFKRLDRNIDQASKTLVRVPGVDLPSDIRDRIESQDKAQSKLRSDIQAREDAKHGEYTSTKGLTMKVGQEANVGGRYIGKVSKIYKDGSYDVQPD